MYALGVEKLSLWLERDVSRKVGRPDSCYGGIADNRCRFWHFNFGSPGALNDLNILDRSPLFDNAVCGESPSANFVVNGNAYQYAYWLGDGIYPRYACFVNAFAKPQTRMQKMFALAQEAKRKDIEQVFGMLQARFHILTSACRLWERHATKTVIQTCVILHNLVIDFEYQNGVNSDYINDEMYILQHPFAVIPREEGQTFDTRSQMISAMQNSELHMQLQLDLMIDRWEKWYANNNDDDDDDGEGAHVDENANKRSHRTTYKYQESNR